MKNELLGKDERVGAVEVKDDDCYYDHHGYCQAHNLEEDCHVARAKKWLEENKK